MFATSKRLRALERRTDQMAGELEALKAAIAADADMDAKLVAHLNDVSAKLADVSAKLAAAASKDMIDPAEIQAQVDALNAHVADMAQNIPASN